MAIDVGTKNLITLARAAAEPAEPSPFSQWLRMEGEGRLVYVARDAWSDSCSVLMLDENGETSVERFSRRYDAVARALSLSHRRRHLVSTGAGARKGSLVPFYPPAGA